MALFLAHRSGEHAANLGPDPVVVKPIMPGPDGLPGAKILRQVAPSAASLVQIQTGVDHLAHIRRQRLVNRKMWRNCLPLGIRQIAWIAPTVILVAFAMLRRPHGMLLLVHQQRTTGGSGRSLISRSVKQALKLRLALVCRLCRVAGLHALDARLALGRTFLAGLCIIARCYV